MGVGPRHHHFARFEGLTEAIQGLGAEFRELV
jgi:hypothetical protein